MVRASDSKKKNTSPVHEIGVSGIRQFSGYIQEEFLTDLQGVRGHRVYREMSDNDPIVGAILGAVDTHLRAVPWKVNQAEADTTGEYKEFVESLMEDMDSTWSDFISEALTMTIFGYSVFETVLKRRLGPKHPSSKFRSKFSDGWIGIYRLAPRAQESIERWDYDEETRTYTGLWQQPPNMPASFFIPKEKLLCFQTISRKANPEGRSLLRNAYTSYYGVKHLRMLESIGYERDLSGLPVAYVPAEILTNEKNIAVKNDYEQLVRDVRMNEQAGIVLPSETYTDPEGKPTNIPKVRLELLSTSSTRATNISQSIERNEGNIARTLLADFIMLGQNSQGSFALSKSKTNMFLNSMEALMKQIQDPLNNYLLPKIWRINGFDPDWMPTWEPDQISPIDLEELGNYVSKISGAGVPIAGDHETEVKLREVVDLPTEPVFDEDPMRGQPMVPGVNLPLDDDDKEDVDNGNT